MNTMAQAAPICEELKTRGQIEAVVKQPNGKHQARGNDRAFKALEKPHTPRKEPQEMAGPQ